MRSFMQKMYFYVIFLSKRLILSFSKHRLAHLYSNIFQAISIIFPLLLLLLIKLTQPPMLVRNYPTPSTPTLLFPKSFSHSLSTEESLRCSPTPNKEKSQLCKRFIQDGCCPYHQRCKFAHGLHQLKKNQQANSKYKTKSCGTFLQLGCCLFGNRCNFIHTQKNHPLTQSRSQIDVEMMQIRNEAQRESGLMKLLQQRH